MDKIKIPYLGLEYDLNFFFGEDTELVKELVKNHECEEIDVLDFALNNFQAEWAKLNSKFGHLYGLWDDCVVVQLIEILDFEPHIEAINPDRNHIYFNCKHPYAEV